MEIPGKDRNKRACDSCYRRKVQIALPFLMFEGLRDQVNRDLQIQCDATPLQCNYCKHRGLVCTYNRPFGRQSRPR